VPGGGEPGHVGTGLGDDDVRGQGGDPGDGADQVVEAAKRFQQRLDPGGQSVDGRGVLVDQVQVDPGEERVVLGEPAGQRLGQGGDLGAQPAFCQVRQRRRVTGRRR